jgi:hypothetical protein
VTRKEIEIHFAEVDYKRAFGSYPENKKHYFTSFTSIIDKNFTFEQDEYFSTN